MPSSSNKAASAPVSVIVSLPRASSVIPMSATLIRAVVSVFSARLSVVLVRFTAVGASFSSVTLREKSAVTGVLPASEVSSTFTVTS